MKKLFLSLVATLMLSENAPVFAAGTASVLATEIKSGLRIKPPYYMQKGTVVSGIDAEIGEAILKKIGISVSYGESSHWEDVLKQLSDKKVNFVGDNTKKEKSGIVFSKPYRTIDYQIISKKENSSNFKTSQEFFKYINEANAKLKPEDKKIRVGYVSSVNYSAGEKTSPSMMESFKNEKIDFKTAPSFMEVLDLLFAGEIDYAVTDAMHAKCVMEQKENTAQYTLTDINVSADRHFMFNAGVVDISKVDQAIDELQKDGSIDQIIKKEGRCVASAQ